MNRLVGSTDASQQRGARRWKFPDCALESREGWRGSRDVRCGGKSDGEDGCSSWQQCATFLVARSLKFRLLTQTAFHSALSSQ